ncbi:MAG: Asp-tRNA(Asn)/Glu-tRNA(Gln) amidotransferase subunit GatB [Chloroflexi bacterium]|nr:Asp-tRNA(Asn)/Glu-tRNA(Gln) amidotransferase subunit GatB [Chloroflexota bacterium]
MTTQYEAVVGLEVHAVMETQSKMFCDCPVVDSTHHEPNVAVCPVCAGMPGMLPVLNKAAVEFALRVALALHCEINSTSIFARKSYFYPDLPKGFQISQYEQPLAVNGWLRIPTESGELRVGIRRVHLEEDTGKLTHLGEDGDRRTLVDLNRSGVPLLEIVTEPDLHTVEAVRNCAYALRSIMRYLEVNSGNLEKGLLRIEPNISIRERGSQALSTRVEIKNLNSFRSLERALEFELARQAELVDAGGAVQQQTLGWDDVRGSTQAQRSKEVAEDYRYFPEPDLPPLVVDDKWVREIEADLPELPQEKRKRFVEMVGLSDYDAGLLVAERSVAEFFDAALGAIHKADAKMLANWITGPLFELLNKDGYSIESLPFGPEPFAELVDMVASGEINASSARSVLSEMAANGKKPKELVQARGLAQISSETDIGELAERVIQKNSQQVADYVAGKDEVLNWFFGQAMLASQGKANPTLLRQALRVQLDAARAQKEAS